MPGGLSLIFTNICFIPLNYTEEPIQFVKPLQNIKITELPAQAVLETEINIPNLVAQWLKNGRVISLKSDKYKVRFMYLCSQFSLLCNWNFWEIQALL